MPSPLHILLLGCQLHQQLQQLQHQSQQQLQHQSQQQLWIQGSNTAQGMGICWSQRIQTIS